MVNNLTHILSSQVPIMTVSVSHEICSSYTSLVNKMVAHLELRTKGTMLSVSAEIGLIYM